MKTKAQAILVAFALLQFSGMVTTVSLIGCSGGCASSPTSYSTLAVTQKLSVAALESFATARAKGKVDDAAYLKVNELYKKYQAAYDTALTAAQLNINAPTPENVKQLATEFVALIAQVTGGNK